MRARAIPIRNIYYLFLYAWGRFAEGRQVEVGTDDSPDLANLLARVLANGVRRLLRRGIDRDYQERIEELRHPRGRLLPSPSIAGGALVRQRLVCAYDELTPDAPANRILKATLRRLAAHHEVQPGLRDELRTLARRFDEVHDVPLSRNLFRRTRPPRGGGHYDLLLRICEMAFEASLPEEGGRGSKFTALLEDEVRMSMVFEQFVRNFLDREQLAYRVGAEFVEWSAGELDQLHERYLPGMRADVVLRSDAEVVIIDTKFYAETFRAYRGGHPRIRSEHLYQILSYLEHAGRADLWRRPVRGLLVYPSIDGQELRLDYTLGSHRIGVRVIDLARHWTHVHERMLGLALG
ncbi:hypothetical protein JMJ56_19525 [Belnapia sp. T18]|uniref:5-methylcytosine-specific restriction enzyme subunit McrC n=1 Tax=Belnapia arida TaxID=2804533 RepID=A0ABS1U929_9PROT|nr:hypothetical protein [Belnapia arida]MBL6080212.1 hypothetical protein [Belnapia arida]